MKIQKLMSIVLLYLCSIGFMSCENDDNQPEYQLQLSENSCELVQGRSDAINLTAHENTTLDIKAPQIIDAVYTWESGSYKAKIEIKGKLTGETDIVVTDHETEESAVIKVKVTEYPMPHLGVKQPKGNIFSRTNFYLYNENSQSIDASSLSAVCDSIVWTADGLNGSYRVFEYEEGNGWVSNHLTLDWEHCFKYPSEYKTYLTAWKDNKVTFRHQLDITVTDDKDFLEYNWNEITKDSQVWNTYSDVLGSSPLLMTTSGLSSTVPYVEVRLFNSDMIQDYYTLYNYLCKLYSTPTYNDKTKEKIWQLYAELFSEQKKYPNAYIYAIWVTERTNIALLLLDESMDYPGYVIYAEPNRQ